MGLNNKQVQNKRKLLLKKNNIPTFCVAARATAGGTYASSFFMHDFIIIESDKKLHEVELRNSIGQIVYHQNTEDQYSHQINLQTINSGIYFVRVSSENNKTVTSKIIIR